MTNPKAIPIPVKESANEKDGEEFSELQMNDGDSVDADLPMGFDGIEDVILEEGKS